MKKIIQHHKSLFYITLCLTLICWIFVFIQLITNYIPAASQKVIPAFQSIENTEFPTPPDSGTVYTLLKKYDSGIHLVSCHKEKNYTDLYFYSPVIHHAETKKNTRNFNLQVAITRTHTYFGTPMIQYDF